MTISVGAKLPDATFFTMTPEGPTQVSTDEVFSGKTVALFAVPGAFTPTCTAQHMPSFVANADAIKAKGVDEIACTSVNDIFAQTAWAKSQNADGAVTMLADPDATFATALGLTFDGSGFGLGIRSQRYSMLVRDGVVEVLNVEDNPGAMDVSDGATLLGALAPA